MHAKASEELVASISKATSLNERLHLLSDQRVTTNLSQYHYGSALAKLGRFVAEGNPDSISIRAKIKELFGDDAASTVRDSTFVAERTRLDDTLLILKYRSFAPPSVDIDVLRAARVGYEMGPCAEDATTVEPPLIVILECASS